MDSLFTCSFTETLLQCLLGVCCTAGGRRVTSQSRAHSQRVGHQMHKHPSNSVRRREKKVRGSREGGISDGSVWKGIFSPGLNI